MSFSEIFIKRPIATSLLMLAIALFGVVAYRALPVASVPNVEYPSMRVQANLPGADPATMASAVASPLERQFTTIAGLDSMSSQSSIGNTQIALQFDLNRNIDDAAVDVQTAIAAVMPLLPAGMPAPPSFRKSNPADEPIINIVLTSSVMPMPVVDDWAEAIIAPRISILDGVSEIDVSGSQKYAVRVQVDPDKMQANQVGLNEIDQALHNWNVNLPTGQLYGRDATYTIKAAGQLKNAPAYRPIILSYRNGAPIRLEQVANVIDSVENKLNFSWLYTKKGVERAVSLGVRRQPGSNIIDVADSVASVLPSFKEALPPSVHMSVRGNASRSIRSAFKDIQITMLVTLVLVVMVIFLFLHQGPATLIPALALPFSILGTFVVMKLFDFSLDNLSMMALILSIGFIVDDAIVMLENIVRHMENGEGALDAALKGSKEVGFTIVSMTMSLAAAFIPILFMGGILGRVFREFAITITTAIIISGMVSISLTPMLCSRFLKTASFDARKGLARVLESIFDRMLGAYEWSLKLAAPRHRPVMLGIFIVVILATIRMFGVVQKGFIPEQDNDSVNVNIQSAQGTSPYLQDGLVRQVANIVNRVPEVDSLIASVGGSFTRLQVQLTPRASRKRTASEIAQALRPQVSRIAGIRASVTLPAALQIGSRMGNSSYIVTLQSVNTDDLYQWAPQFERAVRDLPEVVNVSSDMENKGPRVSLAIDRDKAVSMGLNASQIENVLNDAFGQKWSSTIYGDITQYKVLLEVDPKYQEHADSLRKIGFKSSNGSLVPLESVVAYKDAVGPQSVNHLGQLPAVAISFGLRPGVSLGAAIDRIRELSRSMLPATVTISMEGAAKVFESSQTDLGLLLAIAIGVVYIVLGILYESYIQPLTILSGLPAAGLGALVTLWLFKNELNIYSFVGLVMLVGIVKKNAIMQIDFALEAERRHGKGPEDAIFEGCMIRFRPIMMTTMAALLGAIPIALGFGAGGEARRPLGLAVVGGLVVSQFITLYLTPVVYTYMARVMKTRKIVVTPVLPAPAPQN